MVGSPRINFCNCCPISGRRTAPELVDHTAGLGRSRGVCKSGCALREWVQRAGKKVGVGVGVVHGKPVLRQPLEIGDIERDRDPGGGGMQRRQDEMNGGAGTARGVFRVALCRVADCGKAGERTCQTGPNRSGDPCDWNSGGALVGPARVLGDCFEDARRAASPHSSWCPGATPPRRRTQHAVPRPCGSCIRSGTRRRGGCPRWVVEAEIQQLTSQHRFTKLKNKTKIILDIYIIFQIGLWPHECMRRTNALMQPPSCDRLDAACSTVPAQTAVHRRH
jgi:hypothetical protein